MKTYFLVRNAIGQTQWFNLFVSDDDNDCESGRRHAVPYCIGDEVGGGGRNLMEHVATAILLNHLDGESDYEIKARLLTRPLASKLSGIGSGGKLLLRNKTSWSLNEAEINDMLIEILVDAKHCVDTEEYIVEEVTGQRRDLLREAALAETTSSRLLNH